MLFQLELERQRRDENDLKRELSMKNSAIEELKMELKNKSCKSTFTSSLFLLISTPFLSFKPGCILDLLVIGCSQYARLHNNVTTLRYVMLRRYDIALRDVTA